MITFKTIDAKIITVDEKLVCFEERDGYYFIRSMYNELWWEVLETEYRKTSLIDLTAPAPIDFVVKIRTYKDKK